MRETSVSRVAHVFVVALLEANIFFFLVDTEYVFTRAQTRPPGSLVNLHAAEYTEAFVKQDQHIFGLVEETSVTSHNISHKFSCRLAVAYSEWKTYNMA